MFHVIDTPRRAENEKGAEKKISLKGDGNKI
jgi:hypothetical protein